MEAARSTEEDETCAICLEILNKPVKLPCNHSFCSPCWEGWRDKHSLDATLTRKCPTCRGNVPPSKVMVAQLGAMRGLCNAIKARLNDPMPLPLPKLPSDPSHYNLPSAVSNLPEESVYIINSERDPDEQQRLLRFAIEQSLKQHQEKVTKLERVLSESDQKVLAEEDDTEELPLEITKAVENNDVSIVLDWLGPSPVPKRINAKCRSHMDRTLLHETLFYKRVLLMRLLLQMGANVDPKSCFGTTPLGQSCLEIEFDEAARVLLEWGADPNAIQNIASANRNLVALFHTPLGLGGRRCEIIGLKSRTDLNGKTGVATRYLTKNERYIVHVEETDEKVQVRPVNLLRRDRTPEDCGKFVVYQGFKEGRNIFSVRSEN